MSSDAHVNEVIAKCDVLKAAGLWPREPMLRPRAWIQNFEPEDRAIAAFLLDKFTFYNGALTSKLLVASYNSLGDGMIKAPHASNSPSLLRALNSAILTPVKGEHPNPTDSGYLICRMARQSLHIDDQYVLDTEDALSHAYNGGAVIFVDDFVGSGDQFLTTWGMRDQFGRSFELANKQSGFVAIYITLVVTDYGLQNIHQHAPDVSVCTTHVLSEKSTIMGVLNEHANMRAAVENLLRKYSERLTPSESYMASNLDYLMYGYKRRGLLLGFEHSVPDATLPIFWSKGTNNWEPLIERR